MESPAIATLIKMMETLPEDEQNQVVEHLRLYILGLQDESMWDSLFLRTQAKLGEVARQARKQIREQPAQPFDFDRL